VRILMLAQFYPPIIGGEERHVRNLSLALQQRGHNVSVATIWQNGLAAREFDEGVEVHRLRGTMQRVGALFSDSDRKYAPPFPDLELLLGLRLLISKHKPDIVHAHNWLLHSYLPLKRSDGPRLVVTLHDISLSCVQKNMMQDGLPCSGPGLRKCLSCAGDFYGPIKGSVASLGRWVSSALERRVVDKFLAVSSAIAVGNRLAQEALPFEVIPNFVADDVGVLRGRDDPRLDALPDDGYLLYVGDLRAYKGVVVLLEAYATLRDAPPLVLIGRRCPDTPRELPPNVYIFESWPHACVMHAWSRCLFGIAPSVLPDACASVVIEAMALGKPMIVSDVGGMPDLVDHAGTGIIVPPQEVGALAAAMRRLLEDPELRERMGAAALRRAEHFKASSVVPRIESIYRQLAAAPHRPQLACEISR
jgi:glycosyltransferase involved in cell wall biosynthesis